MLIFTRIPHHGLCYAKPFDAVKLWEKKSCLHPCIHW